MSTFYILSYWSYKDPGSFVGGLRPYKMHGYLKKKGVNSKLIVPKALDSREFEIKQPKWFDFLGPLKKAFPPDASIFWACKVAFTLRSINKGRHFFLLTTCPPNGLVIAGLLLKFLKVDFTWLLDFRDLWTHHPIYNPPVTKRFIDPWLERRSHAMSDLIIANTDWDRKFMLRTSNLPESRVMTIRNGVDHINQRKVKGEAKHSGGYRFIYTGGTTAGQATIKIRDFLQELNDQQIPSYCDFYGEFDSGMNDQPFIKYHGTLESEDVSKVLTRYTVGFIYLPLGSEDGGRIAQKFYDYLGAGVIPVCFRASKEMAELMKSINTGVAIQDGMSASAAIKKLNNAFFNANQEELISFTREFQFSKLYRKLSDFNHNIQHDPKTNR